MRVKFDEYSEGYRIVSIAKDEATQNDLLKDGVNFIRLDQQEVIIHPENKRLIASVECLEYLKQLNNYDVCEIWENGVIYLNYDNSSIDNYFFVTGKCNSNCLMCPSPDSARKQGETTYVGTLIELAKHIPISAQHLTITGGEPFMVGEDIFDFLGFLKEKFLDTEFLMLTNGRALAIDKYFSYFEDTAPLNCLVGIPIHASNSTLHDSITQSKGSFNQTLLGIKRLLSVGIKVELRVVVSKLNMNDLDDLALLIINELHKVHHVSIIAMEMTGSAYINREEVWVPYTEAFKAIEQAVMNLIRAGIDVKLYNFPLCTVSENMWTICEKSISPEKVRYVQHCEKCTVKEICGGVFAGTLNLVKDELRTVL